MDSDGAHTGTREANYGVAKWFLNTEGTEAIAPAAARDGIRFEETGNNIYFNDQENERSSGDSRIKRRSAVFLTIGSDGKSWSRSSSARRRLL